MRCGWCSAGGQIQVCPRPFSLPLKDVIVAARCSSAHRGAAQISLSASGSSRDEYILTRSGRFTGSWTPELELERLQPRLEQVSPSDLHQLCSLDTFQRIDSPCVCSREGEKARQRERERETLYVCVCVCYSCCAIADNNYSNVLQRRCGSCNQT